MAHLKVRKKCGNMKTFAYQDSHLRFSFNKQRRCFWAWKKEDTATASAAGCLFCLEKALCSFTNLSKPCGSSRFQLWVCKRTCIALEFVLRMWGWYGWSPLLVMRIKYPLQIGSANVGYDMRSELYIPYKNWFWVHLGCCKKYPIQHWVKTLWDSF